ncbi:MAG: quinolinate phosphoribosyl transferase [Gemmatimonadaceae bacterium]
MPPRRRKRIDPAAFALPADLIKHGVFADAYAVRASDVVRQASRAESVRMQFSGQREGWLGGVDESIAILKLCVDDWSSLVVNALYEGDRYENWDTVLTIEGPYEAFGHLTTACLGALSRRTRVCTNAKLISTAAGSKPVLLLGSSVDPYWAQPGDGFSAMAGGVKMFSTEAQTSLFSGKAVGAVSHGMIAALGGDTVKATKRFCDANDGVDVIALVDYDNDCAKTSVEVARALEGRLWGVRLDTPETMVDKSVMPQMGSFPPAGVNAPLVWAVRNALDAEGFGDVKIVASGGITLPRIVAFEEDGVPVDVYGVGAALFEGSFDFTADVVEVNGKAEARAGRKARENSRIERVK